MLNLKLASIFSVLLLIILTFAYYNKTAPNNNFLKVSHSHQALKLAQNNKNRLKNSFVTIPERIVHIDLKGAPPKVSYYPHLFPLLRKLGATGILFEYEDMFPYSGPLLNNVSALNAYTIKEIKTINQLAKSSNLKMIPSIDIFGHLEFLLKLEEFSEYREVWNLPSTICPSHNKTGKLLEGMVEQIIDAHSDLEMIHLGCNNVQHLAICSRCTTRLSYEHSTKNQLFLEHINSIISYIKRIKPEIKVLIWDDHFRTVGEKDLRDEPLIKSFTPVVWWYGKDVYDELGPSLWSIYSKVFEKVWISSAFKGVAGSDKYVSDVNHYVQNQKSWLSVIEEHSKTVNFEGIILTGRQRYDHFAILCELLPVGIPALAMNLRLLQGFKDSTLGPPVQVAKILQCDQSYGLIGTAFGSPKCKFPGGDILENIIHFDQLKQEFLEMLDDSRAKGWLNNFNKIHTFSNPKYVKSLLIPLDKLKIDVEFVKNELIKSMSEVYDRYTVSEWLETNLLPFEKKVLALWETKQQILGKLHWPRKPLNFNNNL